MLHSGLINVTSRPVLTPTEPKFIKIPGINSTSACFVVLEQVAGAAKLLHILNTGARPAVELFANLVSLCGSFSHCGGLHGHTLWLGFRLQPELQNMFRCQELQENLPIGTYSIFIRLEAHQTCAKWRSHTSSLQPLSHLGSWHRLSCCSGNPARRAAAGRSPSSAQHEHLQRWCRTSGVLWWPGALLRACHWGWGMDYRAHEGGGQGHTFSTCRGHDAGSTWITWAKSRAVLIVLVAVLVNCCRQ